VPQPLRKIHPALDLEKAQAQVCVAIKKAIRIAGGLKDFTDKLNAWLTERGYRPITKSAVHWWSTEGTFVDRVYWPFFEEITDMAVTRRHLRPDIYRDG
jgi:hypothetical protein